MAPQYGIFGATYGIAAVYFSEPHTQVVVVGDGERARELAQATIHAFRFNQAVLRLAAGEAVPQKLPPALAQTIPNVPGIQAGALAVVCSGFACRPPVTEARALRDLLEAKWHAKAS